MSNLYNLLILGVTVFFVDYPSITCEVSLLDDREMIRNLSAIQHFNFIEIFFPNSHAGFYYRPLIYLSFLADHFVWNLDPAIMHFENIILHLANSILVLFVAQEMLNKNETARKSFPLFASLLFAVHPIATESVNWISGRTDLLSTFFVLLSCFTVFRIRNLPKAIVSSKYTRLFYMLLAFLFLFLGILAKEPAVGFIPAMVFILFGKNEDSIQVNTFTTTKNCIIFILVVVIALMIALVFYSFMTVLVLAICYGLFLAIVCKEEETDILICRRYTPAIVVSMIALIGIFWGIRKIVFASQSSHITRTLKLLFSDLNYSISVFLKAYGFYAKKFFAPLPLNFVIREVNIFYSFLGIIILFTAIVLITRRKQADMLIIAGLCMIAPVLPLTFDSIAWTSYAERYVYPATPFWILSITAYLSPLLGKISVASFRIITTGIVSIIVLMSYSTYKRNIVWQTNIALFSDSVEKTPSYKQLRGLYMAALYEKGFYNEAIVQYQIAEKLPIIKFKDDGFSLFYARIMIRHAKYDEAEKILLNNLKVTKKQDPDVYEILSELESIRIQNVTTPKAKTDILKSMIDYQEKWYLLTREPIHLYQLGQLYLLVDDRKSAKAAFENAHHNSPPNSHYREAAKKLVDKL